jgi:hypothetical protein
MVNFDWSVARDVPAQPVNLALVQGLSEELVVTFGHAPPPIEAATMTGEQMTDHLREHPVVVQQITRLTLPLGVARSLAQGLQDALESYDARAKKSASAGAGAEVTTP